MGNFYQILRPFLFAFEAEKAHNLSIRALKNGLLPRVDNTVDPILESKVFGLNFPNPIGLAAGYDKNGEALTALSGLGFGFLEAGSITPQPQPGNPKPRIFRLTDDEAVINRLGFNNKGLEEAARNFANKPSSLIVGANLGANKDSRDRIADYVMGMEKLAPRANYVTVNISSPNTPGLRALQGRAELEDLLGRISEKRRGMVAEGTAFFPILLKIAPDLTDADKADIAAAVLDHQIDGLVISNTTITRPESLRSPQKSETGGLSGQPLKHISLAVLKDMYQATGGKLPIVGVGGIQSAEDAYARIRAGASLLQLYSAMVYRGPYVAVEIAKGLARKLREDNLASIEVAIGIDTPL
ncbi:quinone-dependent dihydroorotate dehydrogenase [Sneathiella sp. HT1-7]|uniref:quinone-dependent dihydroorotate dehydrogenase n=1 Tax=Sneathiella sp. HT1-7 TaxID=2887192 RepID=UPI001D151D28|nr:quinone-dependent dihydroorotate dehydrogenase [Sneathiella sp. HT1-7]MCC3303257.1 quinone-dependent dihydroorotate dehydrogenase [Sneathiella sp. HT1-7]